MKMPLVGLLLGLACIELGKTATFLTLWGPSEKCLGGEGKGSNAERPGRTNDVLMYLRILTDRGKGIFIPGGENYDASHREQRTDP